LFCASAPLSSASDDNDPMTAAPRELSADDFDWRDIVAPLEQAATLPSEQAIKVLLERSRVLRTYVVKEIRNECRTKNSSCATLSDRSALNAEVTERIDDIVREGILHRHKSAIVDYKLSQQPFPFSEVAAVKSDDKPDAYLMLALPDHSYTAAQLQAKYGDPYDTNIFQWYSVFKYRIKGPDYTSDAVFEVDPTDGAVLKMAISLKMKKSKNRQ